MSDIDQYELADIINSSAHSDRSISDALIRKLAVQANCDPNDTVAEHERKKKKSLLVPLRSHQPMAYSNRLDSAHDFLQI